VTGAERIHWAKLNLRDLLETRPFDEAIAEWFKRHIVEVGTAVSIPHHVIHQAVDGADLVEFEINRMHHKLAEAFVKHSSAERTSRHENGQQIEELRLWLFQ
jgi:hypothetical protein